MAKPIYLDSHATTPVDRRVLDAMLPYFTEEFGNAASVNHAYGWAAEAAVTQAREKLAQAINASPEEIVLTSGATEADNLAIKGVAEAYQHKGRHIVTVVTEHKAILDPCRYLETLGFEVTYLPVQSDGILDLGELVQVLRADTILVSVMAANNEIGVLQPIAQIGGICHDQGILFHTDAAQAIGKIPLDVQAQRIDLMSLTAHKIYGPKGIGALYVRRKNPRVQVAPQLHGGGHERGMRSGTLYTPQIVGFATAVELAIQEQEEENRRITALRDYLWSQLDALGGVHLNGHAEQRLSGNLNVCLDRVEGQALLLGLQTLMAVSSGSACSSARMEPSYVLKAIGRSTELAYASVRFGLGRFTTREEIDRAIVHIRETVKTLRSVHFSVL
ncbi:MAG: IscS subfamily cysteine desulfurase [Prochlorothrix sp.]|nr:IscS subfamily cysteine desulfurase [Prochlorothrix sp.]